MNGKALANIAKMALDRLDDAAPAVQSVVREAPDAARSALDMLSDELSPGMVPAGTVASGGLTPRLAESLLEARDRLGSSFLDFAKDLHNVRFSVDAPRRVLKIADSTPSLGSKTSYSVEDAEVLSRAIQEMSQGALRMAGKKPMDTMRLYRSYQYTDDPANTAGALSFTDDLREFPAFEDTRFIPFDVYARDVLSHFDIARNATYGERELQALRPAARRAGQPLELARILNYLNSSSRSLT